MKPSDDPLKAFHSLPKDRQEHLVKLAANKLALEEMKRRAGMPSDLPPRPKKKPEPGGKG
ncbi:MAG: hypothetical protein Q8O52_08595 [Sulfuritalea sp.]|jgi:hypothetical protein|nr:hypothetical protein [Sulfuritalea sp.]